MIFLAYLDDSKDATQSEMYVCAGFIGERGLWQSFNSRWNARLDQDGLKYFKSSEYKMLSGQFSKFLQLPKPDGRNAARRIRDDLLTIIEEHQMLRWFGVCVPMDEWNAVVNRPEASGVLFEPYHRAVESVMVEVVKRGFRRLRSQRNSVVSFFHDDGPDAQELVSLYNSFKHLNPRTSKYIVGFSCLDDKSHPPLQAADLVANNSLEIAMKWLRNGKRDAELKELVETCGFLAVWREDYARGVLKHELKRKKLPIPLDL